MPAESWGVPASFASNVPADSSSRSGGPLVAGPPEGPRAMTRPARESTLGGKFHRCYRSESCAPPEPEASLSAG